MAVAVGVASSRDTQRSSTYQSESTRKKPPNLISRCRVASHCLSGRDTAKNSHRSSVSLDLWSRLQRAHHVSWCRVPKNEESRQLWVAPRRLQCSRKVFTHKSVRLYNFLLSSRNFPTWNLLEFPWNLNSTTCETITSKYIQLQPICVEACADSHTFTYLWPTELESTQNPGNLAIVVCPPASYSGLRAAGPCLEPAVSRWQLPTMSDMATSKTRWTSADFGRFAADGYDSDSTTRLVVKKEHWFIQGACLCAVVDINVYFTKEKCHHYPEKTTCTILV